MKTEARSCRSPHSAVFAIQFCLEVPCLLCFWLILLFNCPLGILFTCLLNFTFFPPPSPNTSFFVSTMILNIFPFSSLLVAFFFPFSLAKALISQLLCRLFHLHLHLHFPPPFSSFSQEQVVDRLAD
ncbi:hypothetical protein HOY82DRAFT_291840 [Tuber indicum]|nr:hypothetical protein HOY82DRAFT_291840 [Tuber indicum]